MKSVLILLLLITLGTSILSAQQIIPLYNGIAPGSENWNYEEIEFASPFNGKKMLRNVVNPTLEVYLPDESKSNGSAVVICPGGGFIWLSYQSEGTEVAEWLAQKGVTAFVLKYRINKTPGPEKEFDEFVADFFAQIPETTSDKNDSENTLVPSNINDRILGGNDGLKAIEYVRKHADDFKIDPQKIGIMGFSAGAFVTMHAILNSSPANQPDFAAPIYGGWREDLKVPENAPPLFILAAADDAISEGCPKLYKAWRDAGLSAEMHIYSQGGHGFGMDQNGLPVDTWIERFYDWLKLTVIKE